MKRRHAVLIGAVLAALSIFLWMAVGPVVAPPRKPLSPNHRDWLRHPAEHGMTVRSAATRSGAPFLVCEPAGRPGERGRAIRRQLGAGNARVHSFGDIRGTLVLLHGRGMRKEDLLLAAERFCAAGFRCLLPDLPAHGDHPARIAKFGVTERERALPGEVLDAAARRFHFSPRPAGLWGMSLGGAYALQAAAASPEKWDALVVVSSFDALEPVVRDNASRWFRAAAPLARWSFAGGLGLRAHFGPGSVRPIDSLASLEMPIMIVHGEKDELIPLARGRKLFEGVPHPRKRWLEVSGARHGNVLVTPAPVFAGMAAWFLGWMDAPRAELASSPIHRSPFPGGGIATLSGASSGQTSFTASASFSSPDTITVPQWPSGIFFR